MKKFVGDLSDADALVLESRVSSARYVLEFGAGGSTQIIAQSMPSGGRMVSVDTEPKWIETTRARLALLGVEERCRFVEYAAWPRSVEREVDVVFVDGLSTHRRAFAKTAWALLRIGGVMLFHDTRRPTDVGNMCSLVARSFEEVDLVELNARVGGSGDASNISVVRKKRREPYVNWQRAEGKPQWRYGKLPVPPDFWRGTR